MPENPLDTRIEVVIENAMADGARLTMDARAALVRKRLQAAGLCTSVHRVNDHPMALSPLGEIDYPRFHRLPG